ncbi:MAG: DUF2299 family protein [Promethearchaeota archaeon]
MNNSKPPLKSQLRQYLYDIGGKVKEEPKDPKLEFVFVFEFGGRSYSLTKPKKMNSVVLAHGFRLGNEHKAKFEALNQEKRKKFIIGFNNILHSYHLEYNYNLGLNQIGIHIKIFVEDNGIPLQVFYDKFMTLFSCSKVILNFINEFLADQIPQDTSSTGMQTNLYS